MSNDKLKNDVEKVVNEARSKLRKLGAKALLFGVTFQTGKPGASDECTSLAFSNSDKGMEDCVKYLALMGQIRHSNDFSGKFTR